MSPLVRAPAAWKCPNGRLTKEKPFHLVTTAVCTARSYRNTIKMILLPSHITCCAAFCINVLRIKNSMLQSYNKHIHTACHSQTCYNFYYSVICIITVASKATSGAYFFPLLTASSYFYTTKTDVDSYDASFFPYLVSLLTHLGVHLQNITLLLVASSSRQLLIAVVTHFLFDYPQLRYSMYPLSFFRLRNLR